MSYNNIVAERPAECKGQAAGQPERVFFVNDRELYVLLSDHILHGNSDPAIVVAIGEFTDRQGPQLGISCLSDLGREKPVKTWEGWKAMRVNSAMRQPIEIARGKFEEGELVA